MTTPLISVVMSVFNADKYLEEAILSILNQTYKNFEFIIINDGSTDNSLKIMQKYKNLDKRIILINRENKGLPYSLNEGIQISKGKYIARMDADDISLKNRFYEQIKFMEKNKSIDICGSYVEIFGENIKKRKWKLFLTNKYLKPFILFSVPVVHPSVFMKKKIFNDFKYDEIDKNSEDYGLWAKLSINNFKFANISKVLLKYRYLETSITRKSNKNNIEERYNIQYNIFKQFYDILNIKASDFENNLHFTLMANERIKASNFKIVDINKYFKKIIKANDKIKFFNKKALRVYLGQRYLVFIISKKVKNIFKYDFLLFLYGINSILKINKFLSISFNLIIFILFIFGLIFINKAIF